MSTKVGLIILSHANPAHLLRLAQTLQRIYDNPSIVFHHDFSQSPLSLDEFPSGVRFVSPHVKTRWGQFPVVTACLRALELLYRDAAPDWFFLLSGADYPTMRSDKVLEDLNSSGMDAFLDFREVPRIPPASPSPRPKNPTLRHFASPGN